jgi:inorganic pyrophosphatase
VWSHVGQLEDLLPTLREEIEHFFAVYKELEGKKVGIEGFAGRDEALEVIDRARRRGQSG